MSFGRKEYLGDSVFVEVEAGMLKLTTENGLGPSNKIYLEPAVMDALIAYYHAATQDARAIVKAVR